MKEQSRCASLLFHICLSAVFSESAEEYDTTLYGPWQENDFTACKQQKKKAKEKQQIAKDRFEWLPSDNAYRCIHGHRLKWTGKERRKQADGEVNVVHRYRCSPEHCHVCPSAAQCTSNPDRGRSIRRSEHEELIEMHRTRMAMPESKSLYPRRKSTVELAFAHAKENRGLRRFSGRGTDRARIDTALTELLNNLLILEKPPPATESASLAGANAQRNPP